MTKIQWVKNQDGTQGETWNPLVGCKKTSPGCANCYAESNGAVTDLPLLIEN